GIIPLCLALRVAHGQPSGLLEKRKFRSYQTGLLRRSQASPQRIKRGGIVVVRALSFGEIKIEVHSLLSIPEILLNFLRSRGGALLPLRRLRRFSQQNTDVLQVLLSFIQQTVQADRSVVMCAGAEGLEAKRNIEPRFPHGAVALVVVAIQPNVLNSLAFQLPRRIGDGAQRYREARPVHRSR